MNHFLKIVLILTLVHNKVNAICELQCNRDAAHICTGENTFHECVRGAEITTTTIKCPPGYACVNTKFRCELGGTPVCRSQCGICSSTTHRACVSRNSYAYCYGTETPDYQSIQTCKLATDICSSETEEPCLPSGRDKPSCDSEKVVNPSMPTGSQQDVRTLCRQLNRGGKLSVVGDKTCKMYNYCYISRGIVMGKQYQCPGLSVFNCQTQQCNNDICNNQCQNFNTNPSFPNQPNPSNPVNYQYPNQPNPLNPVNYQLFG